jgi:hypothetical protein
MRYSQQEMAAKCGAQLPVRGSHKAAGEVQALRKELALVLRAKETAEAKLESANKKSASFELQLRNRNQIHHQHSQPKQVKHAPPPPGGLRSIKEGAGGESAASREATERAVTDAFGKLESFMETKKIRIKDCFTILDQNRNGILEKFELQQGLQVRRTELTH